LLIFLGCICSTASAVEVITHPAVSETTLSTSQLRRIYTMRQVQWADAQRITVFVLPRQHALHLRFSKERLQMFPYQLDRIWNKLTYSGLGVAPITVNTPEELLEGVRMTPGAIGYVEKTQGMEGVNVIKITN
jgi:ABC-type phosphate transport system substrate-binding protein